MTDRQQEYTQKKEIINTRLFAFAALALSLAACTNDEENLNDGPVAAVINAEISDAVSTRASGTAWAERDEIGISESRFGYANVLYVPLPVRTILK